MVILMLQDYQPGMFKRVAGRRYTVGDERGHSLISLGVAEEWNPKPKPKRRKKRK